MKNHRMLKNCLAYLLITVLVVTSFMTMPGLQNTAYGADKGSVWDPATETPVLVVTGDKLISDTEVSVSDLTAGIANEKAYTLEQLKEMEEVEIVYSTINTSDTKSIYKGKGIQIQTLLEASSMTKEKMDLNLIYIKAADGYTVALDPTYIGDSTEKGKPLKTPGLGVKRYYYPKFAEETPSEDGKVEVSSILAWERGGSRGQTAVPETTEPLAADEEPLLLMIGQQNMSEYNNQLYNKTISKVLVGKELPSILKIGSKEYTRGNLLMEPYVTESYTYSTSGKDKTENVKGIPLINLLSEYDDKDLIEFIPADGYPSTKVTLADIRSDAEKYVIAYEADGQGIYTQAKDNAPNPEARGYLSVYNASGKPLKMISEIKVTVNSGIDYEKSAYKHINNGGITGQSGPYDIDAITGATLTVEGPGVKATTPLSVREVEAQNAGIFREEYTDTRGNEDKTFTYEGVRLLHILEGMGSDIGGINMTGEAYQVELKNRVRQTIATFTLEQLREAEAKGKPVIVAYGTSNTNGTDIAPFVFDGGAGYKESTENDDGCIKLVYDKSVITGDTNTDYNTFGNMAYIYVSEKEEPGYKHDHAPYQSAENSQYVVSVTGDTMGREINYTLDQLEKMVEYDSVTNAPTVGGIGHRDEYSLANNSYWYVNSYEGVKLWDLLLKSGVKPEQASDQETVVSFKATDGYTDFDQFKLAQVADPNQFGYYEKNPKDDGIYEGEPGDLKKTGYPVMVSYGVNGYPYVASSKSEGFKSGLGNDGGPVRIISGKTNYKHANGSKQAKFLDKIIVGTNNNIYSTHKYNPAVFSSGGAVYQNIATTEKLSVKVYGTSTETPMKDFNYTVGEFEDFLYGKNVSNATVKLAKEKDFYEFDKNGNKYSDLYEGVNLEYLLRNIVEIPGTKGTVTFTNGKDESLTVSIDEALATGKNVQSGKSGLSPMIAFAKNGSPMVADKNAAGYEGTVTLSADYKINVKNDGGPLTLLLPATETSEAKSLADIVSVKVNLVPDKYAHTESPYNALAKNMLTVTGAGTRLSTSKAFTVEELEGKQTLSVTGDYNILNSKGSNSQTRYRGIRLYDFLRSENVGLKSNADNVIITCSDNSSYTFSLNEVIKSDYINGQNETIKNLNMILAYGSASIENSDVEDGKPLVIEKTDEAGYDAAYNNSGGPLRLVVGQTSVADTNGGKILKDVVKIEVTASELVSWKHDVSPIYAQYLTDETAMTLTVKNGNTELLKKAYTLAQIEAMDDVIHRDTYTTVMANQEHEGIKVWNFVQKEAATVSGISSPGTVKIVARDGFSKDLISIYDLDQLKNGVKDGMQRKPIIVAYSANGLPLVRSSSDEGYVGGSGNADGLLRSITHTNQGACLKDTVGIEVDLAGGAPPVQTFDFIVSGAAVANYSIKDIKELPDGKGKVEGKYSWYDKDSSMIIENNVKGALLSDVLDNLNIAGDTYAINLLTTDGYQDASYKNITMADVKAQKYFLAYDVDDKKIQDLDKKGNLATVRIYRNMEETPTTWKNRVTNIKGIEIIKTGSNFKIYPSDGNEGNLPLSGVRDVIPDGKGGMWIGTYGAGLAHIDGNGTVVKYNTSTTPLQLRSNYVVAMATDDNGGLWITQCGEYSDPNSSKGAAYISSNGAITYYDTTTPNTIPNNYVQEVKVDKNGAVWFGSFSGLTKYSPKEGAWQTWTKADGLPAESVDNIELDNNGGVWVGCYPDFTNMVTGPFSGGYAYLNSKGTIKPYIPEDSEGVSDQALADFWVRDIAIDGKGGAWVVRSGSYSTLDNIGGRVDYVAADGKVTHYKGEMLIPDLKTADNNPEIRTVNVDIAGDIWFGTSGIGIYRCTAPGTIKDSFSSVKGDWPTGAYNNIYAVHIDTDGTVNVGSNNGVATKKFAIDGSSGSGGGGEKPEVPSSYDLVINGDDIASEIGFTLEEIKAMKGNVTVTYDSLNNYGTRESKDFTGIPVETLLGKASLKDSAKSVKMIARDGYYRQFNLDSEALGIYSKDKDGNPMMLAWKEGKSEIGHLKLVVGQPNTSYINKELWVDDIVNIRVGNKTVNPGSGSSGSYAPKEEEKTSAVTDDKNAKIIADVLNKEGATEKEIVEATTKATDQVGAEMESATSEKEIRSVTKSARAVAEMLHLAATKVTTKEESKTLAQSASSIAKSAALAVTKSSNTEVKADATQATIEAANVIDQVIGNLSDASQIQSIISDLAKNTATTAGKVSDADSKKIKTVVAQVAQTGLNSIGKQSIGKSNVVSANGKDSATVALKDVSSVINVLAKEATKLNETLKADGILGKNDSLKSTLTLTLPTSSSKEVSTTIQAELMEELEKQGIDQTKVVSNVGGVSFNGSAFGTEAKGKELQLMVSKVDDTQVAKEVSLPNGSVVVEFKVILGGESISQFKESVTISIPFDLGKNQVATGMKMYYLGGNGVKTQVPAAFYNEKTGMIEAQTKHFSQFAAVYEPIVFQDVKEGAWYYDAVYQLANAGLINGKSQGTFAPNDSITRAEFVQILYKKAGMPTVAGTAKFKDVKSTDWYFNAVTWAAEKEIVTGADGRFIPNKNISREDMAVILDRFEKNVEKKTLPTKNQAVTFSDEAQIWDYAKEAVSTMQKAGIINGVGNNAFAPKKNATRAEATKMIAGLL